MTGTRVFKRYQQVHFVGIGGVGMSGLAEVILTLGFRVTGSDARRSEAVERLERLGAKIHIGHAASNIDWIARLASETANRVLSMRTTMASGALATYGPPDAISPSWRRVLGSRTTMKCHGCRFIPLPVRRPASTIRRTTSSGTGVSR